jgi:hypothetical protein
MEGEMGRNGQAWALASVLAMGVLAGPAAATELSSHASGDGYLQQTSPTSSYLFLNSLSVFGQTGDSPPMPPYSNSQSQAAFSTTQVMQFGPGTLTETVDFGPLTVTASSPFPAAKTVQATATMDRLQFSLTETQGGVSTNILTLSADSVSSTSSFSLTPGFSAVRSVVIDNLTMTGAAMNGSDINNENIVDPATSLTLLPNYLLHVNGCCGKTGDLSLGVDANLGNFAGPSSPWSELADALRISLNVNNNNGGVFVDYGSTIEPALSSANLSVPEPSAWAMTLLGLAGVGAAARSRVRRMRHAV